MSDWVGVCMLIPWFLYLILSPIYHATSPALYIGKGIQFVFEYLASAVAKIQEYFDWLQNPFNGASKYGYQIMSLMTFFLCFTELTEA